MKKNVNIDLMDVVALGEEYLSEMYFLYMARVKEGFTKYDNCFLEYHKHIKEQYEALHRAESILQNVCDILKINSESVIRAAKATNEYYSRGGMQIIDVSRMIEFLDR